MKAHIKNSELVLLYGLQEGSEKGETVRKILQRLRMPYRILSDEMLGETLGYVAGLPGFPASASPYTGEGLGEEVLLMSGLADQRLNELLAALREGQAPIRLKAVITPNNRGWKLFDLFHELIEEHETIGAFNRLRQTYAAAAERDVSGLSEEERAAWEQNLQKAYQILSSREPTEKRGLSKGSGYACLLNGL